MRSLRVPEGAGGYLKRACQVGPHRASMRGRSEGLANFYYEVTTGKLANPEKLAKLANAASRVSGGGGSAV